MGWRRRSRVGRLKFRVVDEPNTTHRLSLAASARDLLPQLHALASRWGHGIFHSLRGHSDELNGGRMGSIAALLFQRAA